MRRCPFPACNAVIGSGYFCCRRHWATVPPGERALIYEAWENYKDGKLDIAKLRRIQRGVVDRVEGGAK